MFRGYVSFREGNGNKTHPQDPFSGAMLVSGRLSFCWGVGVGNDLVNRRLFTEMFTPVNNHKYTAASQFVWQKLIQQERT